MFKRINYPIKLLSLELLISASLALLAQWLIPSVSSKLNYELFGQTIVTLNSGIIIAIFLAIFHSSNEAIENFKKFKKAARQIYTIFLANSVMISIVFILVNNNTSADSLPQQEFVNLFCGVLSVIVTFVNVKLINNLLTISFRR